MDSGLGMAAAMRLDMHFHSFSFSLWPLIHLVIVCLAVMIIVLHGHHLSGSVLLVVGDFGIRSSMLFICIRMFTSAVRRSGHGM